MTPASSGGVDLGVGAVGLDAEAASKPEGVVMMMPRVKASSPPQEQPQPDDYGRAGGEDPELPSWPARRSRRLAGGESF